MFRPRANSSTSNHEGVFSSFRSRNLSNTSSTGRASPLHLNDLASHDFTLLADNIKTESDLDNITLDDLNIESDPANILMDYLQPKERQLQTLNPATHKIKVRILLIKWLKVISITIQILEPREQVSFEKPVTNTDQSDDLFSSLSYDPPLHTRDKHEPDEVRKPMIIKQLNQLTQKRFQILQDQTNISGDNIRSIESDFDLKIMLLQEELNKLTRDEEMVSINQYSSASNNPYFSIYNNYRPADNDQYYDNHAMEVTENENDYKSDTKSLNTTFVSV